ncbi:MAG: UDP-N-acetylmuramoyl-tripeptide--D-alanyl-D-alanine ligase [Rhabdochlamydiaceae bacterium]|nr:UDP-N-acetylmuramoyl-tripeptide--D-alanyl-D-alanine ligase [Rhabdochlamydiaceae bacterium]
MNRHSLKALAEWLNISVSDARVIHRVEQDSRKVQEGDLFVALKGQRSDGHAHLHEVAQKGAYAALVSKEYQGEHFGLVLLAVDDVLAAVQKIAACAYASNPKKVVAVTGSVGKTTTKEFIAQLLSSAFKTAKTPGNMNSQVSLPLFILNDLFDEEVCVVEMGMSEPGNIAQLVKMIPPDIAVITKIALAHAAYFPDGLSGIAREKADIFSHPNTQVGLMNVQAAGFQEIAGLGSCSKVIYGLEADGGEKDFVLRRGERGFQILEKGVATSWFTLPFTASHLCENFLGAAAVARELGLSWDQILECAPKMDVYPQRFESIKRNGITFINDAYNANPASMKAALENLPKPNSSGKTIAVLGEMREMGRFSEAGHQEVAECALQHVDHVLCLGEFTKLIASRFQEANKPGEHFLSIDELKIRVMGLAQEGDVVLIKGSNSLQLWKVLD